jgi:2-polyprenyl-6-methoxyphenol hydroxylase-like FAD-dependent oxidoreductase
MMCGYLLARAGVDVTVLEKHADFLRDFRGDTVHPSTLEIMHELGLLEDFLKIPHTKIRTGNIEIGDRHFVIGDFSRLSTKCKFIALMPQWDFLDFLARQGKKLPNFHLNGTRLGLDHQKDVIEGGGRRFGDGPTGAASTRALSPMAVIPYCARTGLKR